MIKRLRFLVTVHGSVLSVEFFVIIIKQQFFVDVKYILLLGSERVASGINRALISLVAQCLCKHNLVIGQIAVLDVRCKHDANTFLRGSDMRQCRASHQLLIGFQGIVHLQRIIHMVNIEHHQTVQVTVSQTTMAEHRTLSRLSCVKLIAAENKRCQVVLQLLSKGQQPLFIALFKELLASRQLFKSTLLSQELTIVLIL